MITEDYVSFEVAKLLKEKGFNEPCWNCYYDSELEHYFRPVKNNEWPLNRVSVPTHQMALKWLREVHNIVIEINTDDYMTTTDGKLKVSYSYTIWTFIRHLGETGLIDARYDDRAFWQENVKVGQSYEEAVEAALKYALENLI